MRRNIWYQQSIKQLPFSLWEMKDLNPGQCTECSQMRWATIPLFLNVCFFFIFILASLSAYIGRLEEETEVKREDKETRSRMDSGKTFYKRVCVMRSTPGTRKPISFACIKLFRLGGSTNNRILMLHLSIEETCNLSDFFGQVWAMFPRDILTWAQLPEMDQVG